MRTIVGGGGSPNVKPRVSSGLRIQVTTDSPTYLFVSVLLVAALGTLVLYAISDPARNLLMAVLGSALVLGLLDACLPRAQNRWLHGSAYAVIEPDGVSIPLRPEAQYLDKNGAFELRTPILRRRLRGFERPNKLSWSPFVMVRILPARHGPFEAIAVFDFRGLGLILGGPGGVFRGCRLWLHDVDQVHQLAASALSAGAHVHVVPSILGDPDFSLWTCPENPAGDPRISGTCLGAGPPDAVARLLSS